MLIISIDSPGEIHNIFPQFFMMGCGGWLVPGSQKTEYSQMSFYWDKGSHDIWEIRTPGALHWSPGRVRKTANPEGPKQKLPQDREPRICSLETWQWTCWDPAGVTKTGPERTWLWGAHGCRILLVRDGRNTHCERVTELRFCCSPLKSQ